MVRFHILCYNRASANYGSMANPKARTDESIRSNPNVGAYRYRKVFLKLMHSHRASKAMRKHDWVR
jgi:hypothetical protein